MPALIKVITVGGNSAAIKELSLYLNRSEKLLVVAEVLNTKQLYKALNESVFVGVIVMDVDLQTTESIKTLKCIKQAYPELCVIVSSKNSDDSFIKKCIQAGANAYCNKETNMSDLGAITIEVFTKMRLEGGKKSKLRFSPILKLKEKINKLSEIEIDIIVLLCNGFLLKQIAAKCGSTLQTINFHKKNIFTKTGCKNDAQLGAYAQLNGLLTRMRGGTVIRK